MKKNNLKDAWWVAFLASLVYLFVFPALIMICWNAVIPTIFGLTTLTYWQSFILYILSNILFKGK